MNIGLFDIFGTLDYLEVTLVNCITTAYYFEKIT